VNEIRIIDNPTLLSTGRDVYLTSRVKLSLFDLGLPDFDPSRVKVVTERNVVYLMGLVTPEEAAAVVEKVRYVRGVKRVVKIFEYI
jgi:osmotically-inducible protein OsmY